MRTLAVLGLSIFYFCSFKDLLFYSWWDGFITEETQKSLGTAELQRAQEKQLLSSTQNHKTHPSDFSPCSCSNSWAEARWFPAPAQRQVAFLPCQEGCSSQQGATNRKYQLQLPAGPSQPFLMVWSADAPRADSCLRPQHGVWVSHTTLLSCFISRAHSARGAALLTLCFSAFRTRFSKQQTITNGIDSPFSAFFNGNEEGCYRQIGRC